MTEPQPEGIKAWLPDLSTPEKIEEHRKALEANLGPLTAEARQGLPPIDENALVKQAMEQLEAEGLAASEQAVASTFPPGGAKMDPCVAPSQTIAGRIADAQVAESLRTGVFGDDEEGPPAWRPIPLADLRERIEVLSKAWVQRYRDGNVEITFDTEARKSAGPASNNTERF